MAVFAKRPRFFLSCTVMVAVHVGSGMNQGGFSLKKKVEERVLVAPARAFGAASRARRVGRRAPGVRCGKETASFEMGLARRR